MARNETLTIEVSKVQIIGTMWSYEAAYRREAWIAHAEHEDIEVTHEKARGIPVNKWIGFHCQIKDPEDIHIVQVSSRKSQVFIRTRPDQIVTCIAPPIWVWSNTSCTAGAWCIIATTYVDYWDDPCLRGEHIHTGLIPMSTLMPHDCTR